MSDIRRPPSLINLLFKYAVWFEDIREKSATLKDFETLNKSFIFPLFSINLITACFIDTYNFPTLKALLTLKT